MVLPEHERTCICISFPSFGGDACEWSGSSLPCTCSPPNWPPCGCRVIFFFFSKNIVFLHIHEHALYKRYTCSRSKCWKLQKTVSVGVCNTGECNWHIWLFIKSLGSWCPPLPPLFSLLSWLPSVSPPHLWIPAPPQGTPAGSWPTADAVSL